MPKVLTESRLLRGSTKLIVDHIASNSGHTWVGQDLRANADVTFNNISANGVLFTNTIQPLTGNSVTIAGTFSSANICANVLSTDFIIEKTTGNGIAIPDILVINNVVEYTVGAGITVGSNLDIDNNRVFNVPTPILAAEPATKDYVDDQVLGLQPKPSVRAGTITTGNILVDFANTSIVDGVTLATGDRLLLKDQSNGVENGIYIVAETGTPSRSADLADGSNARNIYTFVEEGTVNEDAAFVCTNDAGSDIVGTDALMFAPFTGTTNAGAGLDKNGSTLSVNTDNVTLEVVGNRVRFGSNAAVTGLTGGSGVGLSVNVDNVTIIVADTGAMQANIATLADQGLIASESGAAVNVDNVTIVVADTGAMQANTSTLAYQGLVASENGTAVNVDNVTINVVDTGAMQANIATLGDQGLIASESGIAVNVDNVTINVVDTGAMQANTSTLAYQGLIASENGTAVNVDGVTINVVDTGAMQANIATLGDQGLTASESGIAVNVDNITIVVADTGAMQANISTLAGDGLIEVGSGMAVNVEPTHLEIVNDSITLQGTLDSSIFASNVVSAVNEIGLGEAVFHVNNVTDLTSALTAITTAGGGKVKLAPETFIITTGLTVPDNCVIEGSGMQTRLKTLTTTTLITVLQATDVSNVHIKDLLIELDVGILHEGIEIDGTSNNIVISDCSFRANTDSLVSQHVRMVPGSSDVIERVKIINCDFYQGAGVILSGTGGRLSDVIVAENTFHDGPSSLGFLVDLSTGSKHFTLQDNVFADQIIGVSIDGSSGEARGVVSGNLLRNNSTNWMITSAPFARIVDNDSHFSFTNPSGASINNESTVIINQTSGSGSATLEDMTELSTGHRIYVELDTLSGTDFTLTPTNYKDGTNLVYQTAGDFALLEWTGSQWTTVDSNFNYLRIDDCGEICVNNTTDLITATTIATNEGSGKIRLAPGVYNLTSTLDIPDNTTLTGCGAGNTRFTQTGSPSPVITLANNCVLSDIFLEATGATGDLLNINNASNVVVEDCILSNCAGSHLTLASSLRTVIDNCTFTDSAGGTSIEFPSVGGTSVVDIRITNSTFNSASGDAICDSGGVAENIIISDNNFNGAGIIEVRSQNWHISDNVFNAPASAAVVIRQSDISVTGNHINDPTAEGIRWGFSGTPDRILISGNHINKTVGSALECIELGTGAGDVSWTITGNYIRNTTAAPGIRMESGNNVITGNYIEDCGTNGVQIDSGATATIVGNHIQGCTSDGIQIAASVGNSLIDSNTLNNNGTNYDISSTGNDFVIVKGQNAQSSPSDPSTISGYDDRVLVTTTTATSCSLGDLSIGSVGKRSYIELDVDSGNLTLEVTSFRDGANLLYQTAGDFAVLEWLGSEWGVVDSNFNYLRVNECGEFCVNNSVDFLTAVSLVENDNGGVIRMAPGDYMVSNVVNLPSNIQIIGSGAATQINSNVTVSSSTDAAFLANNVSNVVIKSVALDFPEVGSFVGRGVMMSGNTNNVVITDCLFGSTNSDGGYRIIGVSSPTAGDSISNIKVSNNHFFGGTQFLSLFGSGVLLGSLDGMIITNNTFQGNGIGTAMTTQGLSNAYIVFSDNMIQDCTFGLLTTGTEPNRTIVVNGNIFKNTVTNYDTFFAADTNVKVSGNYADHLTTDPSGATISGYNDRITVIQNSGSGTITIPDISTEAVGHRCRITYDETGGGTDCTVTPSSFKNGTSLLFDTTDDYAVLEWSGNDWVLVENQTSNFPLITDTSAAVLNIDTVTATRQRITSADGNGLLYSGLYTVRPNTTASKSNFTFDLPNFTAFDANTDITVQVSGYASNATIDEALNNVFGRGNSDGTTGNVLVSFTSTDDSPNLDHILQVYCRYSPDN